MTIEEMVRDMLAGKTVCIKPVDIGYKRSPVLSRPAPVTGKVEALERDWDVDGGDWFAITLAGHDEPVSLRLDQSFEVL